MALPPITLNALSALDEDAFTRALGDIFEHSPWVARRTWAHRPFDSLAALHQTMVDAMREASVQEQLALIRAHPELAGRLAQEGRLTAASGREQRSAGLDQCSPEEQAQLQTLNAAYREKFDFPFIIAVSGLNRAQVLAALEARLGNDARTEFQTAMTQIARIARLRLEQRLGQGSANPAPSAWPLRAEPLNATAFQPFGQVIEIAPGVPYFDINDGTTRRYHDLAALEPGPQGRVIVSLFRGQPHAMPLIIRQMERHPLASQAFIPLSGRPWLAVVAPAGPAPQARALRLFVCRGNQGLNYAPGTWHHALIALDAPSDFVVLDREGPGENCDFITLDEPAIIHTPDTRPQPTLSQ